MPAERIAGVLLAAGSSSRMGRNKLLIDVAGEPLLARAARQALAGGLDPVVVVLGHEAERARASLHGLDLVVTVNADHAIGQHTSVAAGIAALPANVDAAMILLADMPFVSSDMVRGMIERRSQTGARLVISRYGEVQAPPALYDRTLFAELCAMTDGRCGREVISRHREEAETLVWPDERLADLDEPADLATVLATAARLDAN